MLNCYYLVVQEWESPEEMSPTLLGHLIFRRMKMVVAIVALKFSDYGKKYKIPFVVLFITMMQI